MYQKQVFNYPIFLLLILLLTSCSSSMDRFRGADTIDEKPQESQYPRDQTQRSKSTNPNYWIVARGETIETISNSTGASVNDIAYYNSLSQPYMLVEGMRLYIAKRDPTAAIEQPMPIQSNILKETVSNNDNVYNVKVGDSVSSIAMKFGISKKQLIELNQIKNPSLIFVGQELKIVGNSQLKLEKVSNQGVPEDINSSASVSDEPNNSVTSIPQFRWPVLGRIINNYKDEVYGRINNGVYISAPLGSEISSSERGVVTFVGSDDYFGNLVIIKHLNKWVSSYAHLDKANVLIGDKIEKGEIIGTVGASGVIESPQLYFELRRGSIVQDPASILN